MHICFLLPPAEYYSPVSGGAVATIAMQHAVHLLARGHKVTVLAVRNEDEVYDVGEFVAIRARQRDQLSLPQRALSRLRRKLQVADLAYYEYYLSSFTQALRRLQPAPDVTVIFNDLVSPKYIKKVVPATRVMINLQNEQRTRQQDLRPTIASVHTFVACSQYIRDWTAKTHGVPPEKLAVINNGIDLEAFHPRPDFLEPREPLRVLCIGRIDPNKGPDIAADAVGVLQQEGRKITFTLAGGLWFYGHGNEMADPYFCKLKEKMDAIGGEFLGYVTRPNVPALVREYDVVCVLSRVHDPNPLVCLEGMASGCAVIGANMGGIPDAFGEAGMLVDQEDFQAVVGCLRALATDPETLKTQKRKSVERASRASWSATVDKFEEVIRR